MKKHENEEEQFLCVFIRNAKELLPMDNGGLHTFCVTAYYPGEAEDDCHFLKTIKVPYNPRFELGRSCPEHLEFQGKSVGGTGRRVVGTGLYGMQVRKLHGCIADKFHPMSM
eukprot:symbB.v1.2.040169.t1/scaffold7047.1/size13635/1